MMGPGSIIIVFLAILISISAIYNAYLLRGGKLAWGEMLIAMSMIVFIFAQVLPATIVDWKIFQELSFSEALFILGFLFLFLASVKIRFSLK